MNGKKSDRVAAHLTMVDPIRNCVRLITIEEDEAVLFAQSMRSCQTLQEFEESEREKRSKPEWNHEPIMVHYQGPFFLISMGDYNRELYPSGYRENDEDHFCPDGEMWSYMTSLPGDKHSLQEYIDEHGPIHVCKLDSLLAKVH